jgi:cyanophycin synthetase
MNLFKLPRYEVLIDYAHNIASMEAIADFIDNVHATYKIGIVAGIGDRLAEDTVEIGRIAAETFDEIIIRQDKDLRGANSQKINSLIKQGIMSVKPNMKITEIKQETRALAHALEYAPDGAFIALFSEDIPESIKLVDSFRIIEHRHVSSLEKDSF